MSTKGPYDQIRKNLFNEQATAIITLLMPGFKVLQVIDIELPELRTIEIAGPASELEKGVAKLVLPEAQVLNIYQTEWIEHSGKFERAYRVRSPETDEASYLVIEIQTEREAEKLPRHLLVTYTRLIRYAQDDGVQVNEYYEDEEGGTIINRGYFIYPAILCPFPHAVPEPIRDMFNGKVTMAFNFKTVPLWEKDAREFLNSHVSATYFLLPAMKNTDAGLLRLAIEELAERFQGNEQELGRHLTGLSMMLERSEMMSNGQKLLAEEHLKPYAHLIRNDSHDE
jgi:hypothetical protein